LHHGCFWAFNGLRIAPLFATLLLAISIFSFATRPAAATTIVDGDDFVSAAPVGDPFASSTYVTSEANSVTTPTFTANVESWVYADSASNPYVNGDLASTSGAMTFVYQISVGGSTGDVGELDVASFGSNRTDVGYYDQTQFTSQTQILPSYLDRDLTGSSSTVSFLFFPISGQYQTVNAGSTSALLVVNTDSTTFASSYAELQDGSNGIVPSFAVFGPVLSPTPEPASIVLMVLGLTGLLAVARGRRPGRFAMPVGS